MKVHSEFDLIFAVFILKKFLTMKKTLHNIQVAHEAFYFSKGTQSLETLSNQGKTVFKPENNPSMVP